MVQDGGKTEGVTSEQVGLFQEVVLKEYCEFTEMRGLRTLSASVKEDCVRRRKQFIEEWELDIGRGRT